MRGKKRPATGKQWGSSRRGRAVPRGGAQGAKRQRTEHPPAVREDEDSDLDAPEKPSAYSLLLRSLPVAAQPAAVSDDDLDAQSEGSEHALGSSDASDASDSDDGSGDEGGSVDDGDAAEVEAEAAGDGELDAVDGAGESGDEIDGDDASAVAEAQRNASDRAIDAFSMRYMAMALEEEAATAAARANGAFRVKAGKWTVAGDVTYSVTEVPPPLPSALPATATTAARGDTVHLGSSSVRERLAAAWERTHGQRALTPLQSKLFPALRAYRDVLFAGRTVQNAPELRQLLALHVLDHAVKARDAVLDHDAQLAAWRERERAIRERAAERRRKAKEEAKARAKETGLSARRLMPKVLGDAEGEEAGEEPEHRDQGFTRPRVLVLLPVRSAAERFVRDMLQLLPPSYAVHNRERFFSEYGAPAEGSEEEEEARTGHRSERWRELFGANNDDCFKLGIAFSRKSVRLYSEFYRADIIVASPLGLRLVTGAPTDKKREYAFLSSIEMLVVDQADAIAMQNWDVLLDVLSLCNLIPTQTRDTDFSRVREWNLSGHAALMRQTVLVAEHLDPEFNALFSRKCRNVAGGVRVRPSTYPGSICRVAHRIKQLFRLVPCATPVEQGDARFLYFVQHLFPLLVGRPVSDPEYADLLARGTTAEAASGSGAGALEDGPTQARTLVLVPSYFDFVRLRNLLMKESPDTAVFCSEYSSPGDVARSRSLFYHGRVPVLVITGRFHFFRELRIRGAHHLVCYGVPAHEDAYSHHSNTLDVPEGHQASCTVLFTEYEGMQLERVVGTDRCKRMLTSGKSTFLFY